MFVCKTGRKSTRCGHGLERIGREKETENGYHATLDSQIMAASSEIRTKTSETTDDG